jgi:ribonuclease Z
MKMVFLGTGATTPSHMRFTPSIVICATRSCLLLDCGEGTQIRLQEAGIDVLKVKYVIITHAHGDHIYGLKPLIDSFIMRGLSQKIKEKKLYIYAPRGFCSAGNQSFTDVVECHEMLSENRESFIEVEEYIFKQLPMLHGDINAFGIYIIIKSNLKHKVDIFYSGDGVCSEECIKFLKTVKPCLIIHEASFLDYYNDSMKAKEKFHATVANAAKLATEVNAKILILTHISSRYRNDDLRDFLSRARRIFNGDIFLASDLSTLYLNRVLCE